ncbi:dTDP-4-dehydrorhamnose reductase [Streptomyces albidoflavus]
MTAGPPTGPPAPPGRWLVTGAGSMLAHDLLPALERAGVQALPADRARLDLTDPASVRRVLARNRPAVVVNCAAWTAVDDAETHEEQALAVNGHAVRTLAEECRTVGAVLLHLSTDYVFAGEATAPYGEEDATGPRTAYGRTKLAGERAVREILPGTGYVVRTAWLYGAGGDNFVRTLLRLERERDTLDVVDDQRGQPTWTVELARLLVALGLGALAGTAPAGIYHGTASGDTTWCGLGKEVFRLAGAAPGRVRPTTTAAFPRPAPRPAYSVLGHARWKSAGIDPPGDWRTLLAAALPTLATDCEDLPSACDRCP